MVTGESVLNLTEVFLALPSNIVTRIEGLMLILKAVGVVVIIYIIYVAITGFINFRNTRRIRSIEERVSSMDKKIDVLLKRKKKK